MRYYLSTVYKPRIALCYKFIKTQLVWIWNESTHIYNNNFQVSNLVTAITSPGFYSFKSGPFKIAPDFDSVAYTDEGQVLCVMNNVFEYSVGIMYLNTEGNIVWSKIIRHTWDNYTKLMSETSCFL